MARGGGPRSPPPNSGIGGRKEKQNVNSSKVLTPDDPSTTSLQWLGKKTIPN